MENLQKIEYILTAYGKNMKHFMDLKNAKQNKRKIIRNKI